jgi:hypothetical protein
MAKTEKGNDPKKDRQTTTEVSPPLLSEKLIAQFQNAVRAARNKRIASHEDAPARSPEKELVEKHPSSPSQSTPRDGPP